MPAIRSPRRRTLPATRPNAGIEAQYRAALDKLIREMQADVVRTLRAAYAANEPEIAQDRSPAAELNAAVAKMAKDWQRRFDAIAKLQATRFASSARSHADQAFRANLKKAGFGVEFKMTAAMNDAYQAVIAENVGLIKSIPSEYFTQVQGEVMRSVQAGRDLGTLTKSLEQRYGITRRRAATIARDQCNKATAVTTRVRQVELGLTEAQWMHSHAGKHPRPEHVKADGKTYDVRKGMFLEGKWVWPGTEINCRCVSRTIVPGFD